MFNTRDAAAAVLLGLAVTVCAVVCTANDLYVLVQGFRMAGQGFRMSYFRSM
jgi:hypothetical protein